MSPNSVFIVLLNGTLCTPALWKEIMSTVTSSLKLQGLDKININYADISTGASISDYVNEIYCHIITMDRDHIHDVGINTSRHSDNSQTILVGYSLGGIIALEYARRYLHSIDGLILICCNPKGHTKDKQEAVEKQLKILATEGLEALFDTLLLPAYFGDTILNYVEESRRVKQMGLSLGIDVLRNQLATLSTRTDQTQNLHAFTVPTLILCGTGDKLCTLDDNRLMNTLIPNSTMIAFETGHMLPLLEPIRVAGEIHTFISKKILMNKY